MLRNPVRSQAFLSRRATLGGAGALAAVLGVGSQLGRAAAQGEASTDLSGHPMAGTWLAMANPPLPDDPQVPVPALFGVDGTVLLQFPLTQRGPDGPVFNSASVGIWEPDGDRRAHFTVVHALSDATGAFLGTLTIDGYPEASEDGQTFYDDNSLVMVTIRDAAGAVVQEIPGAGSRPVTGIRMGPGSPGFPATTPEATPAP